MTYRLKMLLLAGVAALSASTSFAQQAELPDFLSQIEGVQYRGQMSGMDIYSMEGFQGIWLVSSDGMAAVAGTVFGNDGRDIGSAFSGAPPVRSFEISPQDVQPVAKPAPESGTPQVSQIPQEDILPTDKIDMVAGGLSKIGEDIPHQGTAAAPAGEAVDPSELTKNAQEALEGFSQTDKVALTAALAELIKDAKNEREFQIAVKVWTEEIARQHKASAKNTSGTLISSEVQDEEVASTVPDHPEVAAAGIHEAETGVSESSEPVNAEQEISQSSELTVADELLQEVRTDAMWFGMGKADAPVAYAFIDPTCPYCAKTIKNLEQSIGAGELQLRIMLAPVLSERSGQYIASILSHEEPPIAFLEHELGMANGRSPLKPGNWQDIPGVLRDGLIHNAEIMKEYGINGVPFLVFDTEDGAKVINGVPTPEALSSALPDKYRGDM
ncbi:hypothetical protein LCGC14_0042880 [marine sediment metagenome]|uniref:Thioredoxin-like fold domain-containing protein n=2 Tax=root TaxID=1 RepID=A0A7V1BHJ1_9RHOB|nr:thioredoxin fold domain-containing protein [Sulfitobacter litoralis]HDZ53351.1 hypothetical protein [Sulfitobacter litoralis]